MAEFGRVDIIVHSAGGPGAGHRAGPDRGAVAFGVQRPRPLGLPPVPRHASRISRSRGEIGDALSSAAALRAVPAGTVAYQVVKASLIQMARAPRATTPTSTSRQLRAPGIIRTPFQAP